MSLTSADVAVASVDAFVGTSAGEEACGRFPVAEVEGNGLLMCS